MDKDLLKAFLMGLLGATILILFVGFYPIVDKAHPLTLVGQYTVYNYTSSDDDVIIFLLAKEKLNDSIILTNENDITEKILVTRIPYQ